MRDDTEIFAWLLFAVSLVIRHPVFRDCHLGDFKSLATYWEASWSLIPSIFGKRRKNTCGSKWAISKLSGFFEQWPTVFSLTVMVIRLTPFHVHWCFHYRLEAGWLMDLGRSPLILDCVLLQTDIATYSKELRHIQSSQHRYRKPFFNILLNNFYIIQSVGICFSGRDVTDEKTLNFYRLDIISHC